MATVTQHAPGTFCWPELATLDQNAAKKFYTSLFGWTFNDTDMGPQGVYTIFQSDGADVAALYTMRDEEKTMAPPHWNAYVSVESADRATAKAKELGAKAIMDPFDVMEHGRMAILQDPTGAVFNVWEPKKNIGVGKIGEPNSLCWTELMTKDAVKAGDFYAKLLPWSTEAMNMPDAPPYTIFKRGDASAGGMMQIQPEMGPIPPHWLSYFMVDDTDAKLSKAQELGAQVLVPPTNIPNMGRFAIVKDAQGAAFGLFGPEKK
jgi:predicted enzyme related to lactoylglutathione lyase